MSGQLIPGVSERDHSIGRSDAPVTLVEYGDYQCPYCAAAHPMVQRAIQALGDDLRFVFRNFPLSQAHPNAERAAEAAEAAAEDGMFWEMHDALFERRDEWADAPASRATSAITMLAADIGLDPAAIREAIDSAAHAQRIREDFVSGLRSGVNGTPTFYLNGVRYDGSWDGDNLLSAVREARDSVGAR